MMPKRMKRKRVVLHHPPETHTEKRAREAAAEDIRREQEDKAWKSIRSPRSDRGR